ncbi:FecR family protein [Terrihabitans sp. B22-R8]|uniref:FecR family protein n=1 Tax=Terrihabitans sp. B22-R8 TaxID=3425128 RepID=UPI00403C5293
MTMREGGSEADRLLDEAIDLAIRLQIDPDNRVSSELVRTWRARSPIHEKIWARVADAHGLAGKILTDRRKAERRRKQGLTRRNLVIGGGIGLGAVATGAFVIPGAMLDARADHFTSKGELRRVALDDGSVVTLGPDSAIALAYTPEARRVDLLKGMSFFEAVPEAGRPFIVWSGSFSASASAAAFDVSESAGTVRASVLDGSIDVRAPDLFAGAGRNLQAGDWISFDPNARSSRQGRREQAQIAAWRDKFLLADDETVSSLVAQVGSWLPGRIWVADPFIGGQRVSGLFDLSDPRRALEAIVHPVGGHVRSASNFLTVVSPI